MINAASLNASIRKSVESRIVVYPCHNLRASNIGHPCERYLYLLIKHWEQQEPHDYGLQNIFDLGNSIEEYTIGKLKDAGIEILTPPKAQRSWHVDNPYISGREDIRVKDPDTGELFPGEIKGLSPYEWERLNCIDDFYASKRHYVRAYPSQLLVYMWYFEKEKGFFFLTNKLTGEVKPIDVPFDWDRADALLKKGERVYKCLESGEPPAPCNDITVCEDCKMIHLCTAAHERSPLSIDDGELESLIDERMTVAEAYRRYNHLNDKIKQAVGERERVLTGKYLVEVKNIEKNAYTVEARTERRINISIQ